MFRLAYRNVLLNWRHSLATILAISLGYAAVSLFDGFMGHIRGFIVDSYVSRGMVGHVLVQKTGAGAKIHDDIWQATLDELEQARITPFLEKDARIASFSRFLSITGIGSLGNGKQAVFIGIGHDVGKGRAMRGDKWLWNTVAGRPLEVADQSEVLIGMGLARRFGCEFDTQGAMTSEGTYLPKERKLGCPRSSIQLSVTTEHLQVNALELKPVGVVDMLIREYNDRFIMLPLKTAQTLTDSKRISHFSVLLKDPDQQYAFAADLRAQIGAAGVDAEVVNWLDYAAAASAKGGLEILTIFRSLFLTVIGVISAMSVANSMMKSINERIREIGTLRSFGFRSSDILLMLLAEGLFLGAFSCTLGLLLTMVIAAAISSAGLHFNTGILSDTTPLKVSMNVASWLATFVVLCTVITLTSWLVARRTARMVVADALRHVA
jgi:putative ABC transport system permease protein